MDGDVDLIAETGKGLVDGVIDDLVDKVVQPRRPGGADVHGRALPHGFEALEDLDFVRTILLRTVATDGGLSLVGEHGVGLSGVLLFRMFHVSLGCSAQMRIGMIT